MLLQSILEVKHICCSALCKYIFYVCLTFDFHCSESYFYFPSLLLPFHPNQTLFFETFGEVDHTVFPVLKPLLLLPAGNTSLGPCYRMLGHHGGTANLMVTNSPMVGHSTGSLQSGQANITGPQAPYWLPHAGNLPYTNARSGEIWTLFLLTGFYYYY